LRIETLAVHAGHEVDPSTGAVTPPIHLSTTFAREPDGSYRDGYIYTRPNNPNRASLETALAALEGGGRALAFSSGSASIMTLLQLMSPGDHVIAPVDAYYGTIRLIREVFSQWKLELSLVDMTDLDAVRGAMRDETRLFWLESPSNPTLAITDIAAVATIARDANAICAVDNTWATPLGQRPLELGAHVSMHATTKYLGGHSDVLGGALVFESEGELADRAKVVQDLGGAVPSPFDCWLVMRGLRTLPYRVRAQTQHAAAISAFLSARDGVEQVFWPGLRSHPGREVAERQMTMFGGMLSFIVDGGAERAMEVAGRVRIITRATSLGGPETLIEHRTSVKGPESRSPDGLLRLSVGLEHPDDIIEDLDQALS
jgi:cystathionine gamma-synthase